ncbi:MAG: S8 family serine peptidase, partial [Burkholderiaceae bacterium]
SSGSLGGSCGAADEEDSSWHGTQTAGVLAAATNNAAGMAGVAYDTKVVPVRALGKCGGWDSDIIAAAQWAGGISLPSPKGSSGIAIPANIHPARVINMSLGGSEPCTAAYREALTALRNKGVVVVAAAGNDTGLAVDAPANCKPLAGDADQTPVVIAVAGLRNAGDKVGYSDIGPEVTIAAPAGNCGTTNPSAPCLYPILTTANTGTTTPVAGGAKLTGTGGDASLGTSFSTPMVAGTVALMLAANPALTNAQVIALLKSTARPFPTSGGTAGTPQCTAPSSAAQDECYCTTATCGAGMLDAGNAVTAAAALAVATARISGGGTVATGGTLTLDGSTSSGTHAAAITGYAWAIIGGANAATLSGASGSSVVLTGVAAGTVDVQLTVTDATGASASSTTAITVTAPASAGGGGGASSPIWLALLAACGLWLAPRNRGRVH